MKKYTVYPDQVRGLGNIMNKEGNLEDFVGSNCSPILLDDTVNFDNLELKTYQIKLNGKKINITVTTDAESWSVEPNQAINVLVEVTNEDGTVIGADERLDVYFYENTTLLGSAETENGQCSYVFSSDARGIHNLLIKTEDQLQYDAAETTATIFVYFTTNISLTMLPENVDFSDIIYFEAALNNDGGIPLNLPVEFYNEDTLISTSYTNSDGIATLDVPAIELGVGNTKSFKAKFITNEQFIGSESDVVEKIIELANPTLNVSYENKVYENGTPLTLTATAIDKNNAPIQDLTINFEVGSTSYSATTNEDGVAVCETNFVGTEDLSVTISSEQNNFYNAASITEVIATGKIQTNIAVSSSTTQTSWVNNFEIIATVTDGKGNPVNSGQVQFKYNTTTMEALNSGIADVVDGVATIVVNHEIGDYEYFAEFIENENYVASSSELITITVTKDQPSLTILTTDIYQGWAIKGLLLNSKGESITGATVDITVTNENANSSTYAHDTGTDGIAALTMNWTPQQVTSKFKFDGDSDYYVVETDYNFKIKEPLSQTKYIGTITSVPSTDTIPKRAYDDKVCTSSTDELICKDIASKAGTYNAPAKIQKNNGSWGFSIPTDATLKKVVVYWQTKNGNSSSAPISIPAANFTIYNVGSANITGTGVKGGSNTYTTSSITVTNLNGATPSQVNEKMSFTLFTDKTNTSSNTGNFYIRSLRMTWYYVPAQI